MTHLPPPPVPRVLPPVPAPDPLPAPDVRLVDLGLTEPPSRAEDPIGVTAYRLVSTRWESLPDDSLVTVGMFEVKRLTSTDETLPFNDGTERRETYLFLDAQGRVYHHRPGVEFLDGSSYVRDGDPAAVQSHFTDRLPGHARDLLGRPLTENLPEVARVHEIRDSAHQ